MKKKNLLWGIIIGVIVIISGVFLINYLKNKDLEEVVVDEDPYGIEYYNVPPMDQIFVNGVVTPEESQEFYREESLGVRGDLQVENGQVVKEGTLLYSYTNEVLQKEISQLYNEAARLETDRANTAYKQQLAIDRWYESSEEERGQTLDEITMDFNLYALDSQIQEIYSNIATMEEKVYTEVTAPFEGKVVIPEEKKAEAPLLKLISENFYVSGTINEKDLEKVKVDQVADITVISNGYTTLGKVSFVDTTPTNENSDPYSGASTMSSYPVKLSFNSLERIVNGYHVQATINMEENQVVIPKESIHTEGEIQYVLVNDFGSVVRRVIQTGEETDEGIAVTSGLEAEDEIIVSSQIEVNEGDLLNPEMMEMEMEMDIESVEVLEGE
ncbi:efflux RND transporter periplasmic adaptor subunit [Jeotgalibaca sp. MA1X17-3]|uniref:efflux RND transporter periplasmic adaptor subunit n=1 Tax=Jeotgalibaca sp. MA1X17-3 TaxID=2908211 RepID=UPI001F2009B2|nr:efflux RND transporter periplasmic adaptor subunit [Jeotgalibaca sp. MA1X17-3]UJF16101.1 efflux RND transporter periplasmic adaptor subunit [Jeotgalibaca sp. MA1X17-3]